MVIRIAFVYGSHAATWRERRRSEGIGLLKARYCTHSPM